MLFMPRQQIRGNKQRLRRLQAILSWERFVHTTHNIFFLSWAYSKIKREMQMNKIYKVPLFALSNCKKGQWGKFRTPMAVYFLKSPIKCKLGDTVLFEISEFKLKGGAK
jgi:hypothetical protein